MYDNYDAAFAAASAGVMLVYTVFILVITVLTLVAMWKRFVKGGKPDLVSQSSCSLSLPRLLGRVPVSDLACCF